MRIEVLIPSRHRDIDRLHVFTAFIALSVPGMPFEDQLVVHGITILVYLIHPDFHAIAIIFHLDTFSLKGDNRIPSQRLNLSGHQPDYREASH